MLSNQFQGRPIRFHAVLASICCVFALLLAACKTTPTQKPSAEDMIPPQLRLFAGDVVEIVFPGATNLSGLHRIGPEGSITLPLVGQVEAAGHTAEELQAQLMKLYSTELKDDNVIVSISGSGNVVYINGAVLRPGKIVLDRPLTALEAIMEVGGFADNANRQKVTVVRYKGSENTKIELNFEPVLSGGQVPPFYVRPRDIIHVPAKVQWF